MAVWEDIAARFKGRQSLGRVSEEELQRERINLDQKERQHIQYLQRLEKEQKELLAAGMKEPSEHMKMVYARKVVDKDADIKMNRKVLQSLSRQMRIIRGLEMVKKWTHLNGRDRSRLLNRLSMAELTSWIHDKTVEGEFKDEYLDELAGALERGIGVITEIGRGEDDSVKRVFEIMTKAGGEGCEVSRVQEEVKSTLRATE